jgi:hypothetical protein
MRRLALITALLVPLAIASPAAAKEVMSVTACGDGDCTTSKAAGLMRGMTDIGPPASAPKAPAPFYRLTLAIGDGRAVFERFKVSWVPAAGRLLGEDGTWMAVRPEVRRGLARLTRGLTALPADRLPGFPVPAADVAPPPPAAPVTSDSDLPVVPLLAAALLVALVGVLVRRHLPGSGPSRALHPSE